MGKAAESVRREKSAGCKTVKSGKRYAKMESNERHR
jgi:hypothetical protein